MTGKELLEKLQSLSEEDLKLEVFSRDGYGDKEELFDVDVINDQYRNKRYIDVSA